eukprot:15694_1
MALVQFQHSFIRIEQFITIFNMAPMHCIQLLLSQSAFINFKVNNDTRTSQYLNKIFNATTPLKMSVVSNAKAKYHIISVLNQHARIIFFLIQSKYSHEQTTGKLFTRKTVSLWRPRFGGPNDLINATINISKMHVQIGPNKSPKPVDIYEFRQSVNKYSYKIDNQSILSCTNNLLSNYNLANGIISITIHGPLSTPSYASLGQSFFNNDCKTISEDASITVHDCKMNQISVKLTDCMELQRLADSLCEYYDNSCIVNYHRTKIVSVLNDYLYLLRFSDNPDNFEYIFNYLGGYCSFTSCNIFKRNYRNRKDQIGSNKPETMVHSIQQIMDKIHCFYRHAFDIGNRLCFNERVMMSTNEKGQTYDNQYGEQYFTDSKIVKLHHILNVKRQKFGAETAALTERTHSKYNQINDEELRKTDKQMYSFGFPFEYGYIGENDDQYFSNWHDEIRVYPLYSSFKQELTSNCISTLSVGQFNNDYRKAEFHFISEYRKQTFPDMLLQHILSMMIYCNYTLLQYEFSKTYRILNGKKHSQFYYLGQYLKRSVRQFGTKICYGTVRAFYHGMNQRLMFPNYIGCGYGITIHGPLSTSSSFCVAANFTSNFGLIVEFTDSFCDMSCKYLSVSWLSDFGN